MKIRYSYNSNTVHKEKEKKGFAQNSLNEMSLCDPQWLL